MGKNILNERVYFQLTNDYKQNIDEFANLLYFISMEEWGMKRVPFAFIFAQSQPLDVLDPLVWWG